jgi:hypothetical protein
VLAEETAATASSLAEETAAKAMALAKALGETLKQIAERLDEYSAFGRNSRKIILALAVSFALDIALTVVLGLTAFQAHSTAATNSLLVQEVHASQLTSCANGNIFRADQDVIWKDFIGLLAAPTPGEAASQVAKVDKVAAQFLAYVAVVNHPINCTALYGK